MKLVLKYLGTMNIFDKINNSGYKIGIQHYNREVNQNRYILETILNSRKLYGKHNLP